MFNFTNTSNKKRLIKIVVCVCCFIAFQFINPISVKAQIYATGFEGGTVAGSSYTQPLTGTTATGSLGNINLNIAAATWVTSSTFTTYAGNAPTATTALATSSASPSTTTWTLTIPVNSGYAANMTGLSFDYRLTATSYNYLTISINGTSVYSSSVSNDATFHTVTIPSFTVNCISGNIHVVYTFSGGTGGSGGTSRLDNVSLIGSVNALPTISVEPVNTTTIAGTSTSFNIVATGATTYQWQRNTSGIIGGTWVNCDGVIDGGVYSNYNTATLNITSPLIGLSGYGYQCIVTNSVGCSVVSTGAVLTVTAGSPCSGTPVSGVATALPTTLCDSGSSVLAFSGGSSGLGLTYQWSSNTTNTPPGTNIAGATNSSYTTPTLSATTYYWCSSTCAASGLSNISTVGIVTIAPIPTLTVTPPGGNYCSGTGGLGLTASGASTYTWLPATGLSATTGATVTASSTSAITYTVTGTSVDGCVATDTARVNYYTTPATPVISPTSVNVCVATATNLLTANVGAASPATVSSGTISLTMSGTGYASETPTLSVSGVPAGATVTSASVTLNCSFSGNYQNAYVFNLASPNGKIINLIKGDGCGTCTGAYTNTVISSAGVSAVSTGTTPFTGTYSPDAIAIASGSYTQNTTLFSDLWGGSGPNGTWTLDVYHNFTGTDPDGTLISWSITITYTLPSVTWSPFTNLYTDITGTTTYTGTNMDSVYENPLTAGVITYTATANNNGCTNSSTIVVTVNPLATAGVITGASSFCMPSVLSLTDTATGGTWSSSNPSVATVDGGGNVTGVSSGITTISYTVAGCGSPTATKTITVNALPSAGIITGTNVICNGATTTLADTAIGGIWGSTSVIASVSGGGVVTALAVGIDTITYTITNICGSVVAMFPITINPLPNAGSITGTATVCVASITTLTDTASGGTWSSSATGIATVDGTGHVTGIGAGNTTISYTNTNSCGTANATLIVTVNALPNAGTITGSSTICLATTASFTDTVTGGVWGSSAIGIANVDIYGVVTGVAVGNAVISYTVTTICGSATTTYPVTINLLPSAGTIVGSSSICSLSTTTYTDGVTGGIWGSSNPIIATIGSTGVINALSVGIGSIYYSVTTSCGTAIDTQIINIMPLPNAGIITGSTIVGSSNICVGSVISLTDSSAGGVWSSDASSIASVDGFGVVTGIATGATIITYTVTNSCGSAYTISLVTVNPLPNAGAIMGFVTVCVGDSILLTDTATGGVWSSVATGIATISTIGTVTGIASGIDTLKYTVTNGCGTAIATYVITVNPLPNAGIITGANTVCASNSILLADTMAGGVWLSGDTAIASINPLGNVTGVLSGVATISYTITNSCGTAVATAIITVVAAPNSGFILGDSSLCLGATATLTDTTLGGVWSSTATSIATISGTGIVTCLALGVDSINYTFTNSCGTKVSTLVITINPLPNAGSITGITTICPTDSTLLADAVVGGTWSSASTGIATISSIGMVTGISSGTTLISYSITNMCGTAVATTTVNISALPVASAISGVSLLCVGTPSTFADSVLGGAWSSSDTTIATISTSGIVTSIADGTAIITYTLTFTCGSTSVIFPITVNSLPITGTIVGANTLCQTSTITLTDSISGGTWGSVNPLIASVNTSGIVTGNTVGNVSIYYSVTNSCGTSYASTNVTINPLPNAGTISGTANICVGGVVTLTDASIGGVWSSAATSIAYVDSFGDVTGVGVGSTNISYTVTNSCGSASASYAVTVNLAPVVDSITGGQVVCSGLVLTLSDITTGGTWNSSNVAIATVSTTGLVTGISGGSAIISYTVISTCGATSVYNTITVNPIPTPILGLGSGCLGIPTALSDSTTGGIWSSSNATYATVDSIIGTVVGINPGIATITYMLSTGCFATHIVTVYPYANAGTITGSGIVCQGSSITLSDLSAGGAWLSTNARANVFAGVVTGITAGIDTIRYSVTNLCGTNTTTKVITINPLPTAGTIFSVNGICLGDSTVLTDSVAGGTWSLSNTHALLIDSMLISNTAGIDTIFYTITNLCGIAIATKTISINSLPTPVIGSSRVCLGSSITLSDFGGGTWGSSASVIASIDPIWGIVTGNNIGNVTITYTMPTGCSTTFDMIVNPQPAPIAGPHGVCIGSGIALVDTGSGIWTATNGFATIDSVSGLVSGISFGVDTISYYLGAGCGAVVVINVDSLPTPASGSTSFCTGDTITMTDVTIGGQWSSNNTAVIVDSMAGIITGATAGFDTIIYKLPTGCYSTKPITINPSPTPIIGVLAVCRSASITISEAGGGSYLFSNTNASVGTLTGIVVGNAQGNDTLTYTMPGGCFTTAIITINPTPNAGSISGTNNICFGTTATFTDPATGGTWHSSNTNATINNTTGILNTVALGLDTIYYNVTNICGTASASDIISIIPQPFAATITGTTNVCVGQIITLSDTAAGGSWSSINTSVATVSATGVVTGTGYGIDSILYTVTNTCGTVWASILVNSDTTPIASVTGSNRICIGKPDTLTYSPSGGIWITDTTLATVVDGIVAGIASGKDTIQYTVANRCGADTATFVLQVYTAWQCDSINYVKNVPSQEAAGLNIYPNPNTGKFTVMLSSATQQQVLITITNLVGQTLAQKWIPTNQPTDIDTNLISGMYFITTTIDNELLSKKIFVNR